MTKKNISLDDAYKTAVDFHTKGKISDAANIYKKILEVKPDHFLALSNLGIICSQLKRFNEAIELFNKTLKINPKYAEGYNNLGNVLYELSRFDKSLDCYKKAIKFLEDFFVSLFKNN